MHSEKPDQMNPTTSPTLKSKVCDSNAVGMVLQLADGTIQACNVQAQEILGMTSGQIQGWTSTDSPWQVIHEDGSPFHILRISREISRSNSRPNIDLSSLQKRSGRLHICR
ncbi:MAG: PAS domain S-box protein [Nostocaceae cyanobacterium]|nr:PAS domain S-box protein [Nostocaceae cyanobacterium]